jgi:hypothetical protein
MLIFITYQEKRSAPFTVAAINHEGRSESAWDEKTMIVHDGKGNADECW